MATTGTGTSSLSTLSEIPTLQTPGGGNSNLAYLIQALAQKNANQNPFASQAATMKAALDESDPTKAGQQGSSSFQGYNYGNPLNGYANPLSGLTGDPTGQDYAAAAQAGVASGLTFDPSTGSVY
jgi:hypothetical protein